MNPDPIIEVLGDTARTLTCGDLRGKIRSVQSAQDALDTAKGRLLAELAVSRGFELDGASTLNTWVCNELRMSAREAGALVRAAATLDQLPELAEAAESGQVRAAHINVFTYGLKHIGIDAMSDAQPWLLDVARNNEPAELYRVVKGLREAMFPEALDQAWVDGMDKQDIQVQPVPGGFHVTGFLNPVTGAKFQKVLDSVAAPHDKDDTRTGSERRVQGLDDLLTQVLESGLPSDKGIRPHVSVMADADTLAAAAAYVEQVTTNPSFVAPPIPATEPAQLAGFGSIGPNLLMYFTCVSDHTAFLMAEGGGERQAQVLNVGRTRRSSTLRQRRAVLARQKGVCATPGCRHTHLEIHHTIWWSKGGTTDLDLLIGLCVRCHHLLHRGLLNIAGNAVDGFTFTNQGDRLLRRRRRNRYTRAA